MKPVSIRIILVASLLTMATLACNISNINMPSNPQPPIPGFVPSPNDASAFEKNFTDAITQAQQTGTFNVTVTQQQLSSWVALNAPAFAKQQGYDWPLTQAQVGLDNGKITLYGVVSAPKIPDTPAQVIFTPSIDANGAIAVKVESGQFGIVGLPTALLDTLTKAIKDALSSQLNQIQGRYKLSALTVASGTFTVSGQIT